MSLIRLLQRKSNGEIVFRIPTSGEVPAYAILSHTWGEDEVIYQDLEEGKDKSKTVNKAGWRKIQFCAKQAAADGLEYFWVDTCCIDKKNAVELGAAINSMFRWYQNATRCYVYLTDVSKPDTAVNDKRVWEEAFRKSRWFTRGWTLQELIAPPLVEFFSLNGNRLGNKKSLEVLLQEITGIPVSALQGSPLSDFSFDERVLWARNRDTKFEEDLAYCLIGIFDISLPVIYGEGKKNAFRRLNREWKDRPEELSQATSNYAKQFGAVQQTLNGHKRPVWSVVFSPDSRLLASASADQTVRIWDAATGTLKQKLKGHSDWVTSVAFSPDSRLLASASRDSTVRIWYAVIDRLKLKRKLEGHNGWVTSVVFSPNSRLLASASWDKTVRIWEAATSTLKLKRKLEGHSGVLWSVAFSPDSRLLASASEDQTVRLWDAATGVLIQKLEGHSSWVTSVVFSPDSKMLASASWDSTVRIWDMDTDRLKLKYKLEGHSNGVSSVAFSPNSRLLASASYDKTVQIWDAVFGTLELKYKLEGHKSAVSSVSFSPDSRLLASASYDQTVLLWDAVIGTL